MKIRASLLLALTLSACGGGLSGEYGERIGGEWETTFVFKGKQVEAHFMGQTAAGSYDVKDGKVYIEMDGDTQVFQIDDKGCIEGGLLFGTVCKRT